MKVRPAGRGQFFCRNVLKRFISATILFLAPRVLAQQVTVDVTPGHSTNSFSPVRALGAGIDRDPLDSVQTLYDPAHVATMLTAGWGPISYRLNTELSIQGPGTGIRLVRGVIPPVRDTLSATRTVQARSSVRSGTTFRIAAPPATTAPAAATRCSTTATSPLTGRAIPISTRPTPGKATHFILAGF